MKKKLIEEKNVGKKDYLSLPTNQLLDAYGKGNHILGSGSAAALSGLIASELIKTVSTITIGKKDYKKHKIQFEFIISEIEKMFEPKYTQNK